MTSGAPEWMTMAQAAEYLGVHPNTVRIWLDAGRIKGWRTPLGTRRIWKDEAARHARDEYAARRGSA